MESIFNLESYKDYLISYFGNKGDQSRREVRKQYIESHYSDEELNTIVVNTEMFVLSILKEIYLQIDSFGKNIWLKKEISNYFCKSISNGCLGGWQPDSLFCPDEQKSDVLVSKHLIKESFGNDFSVEISYELIERYDEEDDVGYFDCYTYFAIGGSKKKFLELLDKHFEDRNCLVKK